MEVIHIRRPRATAAIVAGALVLGPGAAVAAAPATGVITQKHGRAGCLANDGAGRCARARALDRVNAIALSADGKNAYVASPIVGLAVLDRDPATGALAQKRGEAGCFSDLEARCGDTPSATAEYAVVVSPDDKNVYSGGLDGLSVFDRDPVSGALAQKVGAAGCFSRDPFGGCTRLATVDWPDVMAISPDGLSLYVGSFGSDTLTVFDRDATGALHPKPGRDGCLSRNGSGGRCARAALPNIFDIATSPDARSVYVGSGNGVVAFDRVAGGALRRKSGRAGCISGSGGRCVTGKISYVSSLAISADGRSMYVAGDPLATFDLDPATGAPTQKPGRAGCISDSGTRGRCTNGKAMRELQRIALSSDGLSLYAAGRDGVSVFDRHATTGTLRQKRRLAGCVSENGSRGVCANGKALRDPRPLAVSHDARNVYVGAKLSNAVAVFDRR